MKDKVRKHTPGPWRVVSGYTDSGFKYIGIEAPQFVEIVGEFGLSENNARLIAASPDLLDALENAVSQMEMASYCVENGRYDEALLHLNSLMSGKRAAIAKARGEA